MILVVRELVFYPFVDLFEREVFIFSAADGHLDEMHVAVGRTLLTATFCTDLKVNNQFILI